jgi:hypothetical protein
MLIAPSKEGTYVYTEPVKGEELLVILYIYQYSREVNKIKMSRIRPHKSLLEEELLGTNSIGILEAFDFGTCERQGVNFLDYHEEIIDKEYIFNKYPEYLI